MTVVTMPVHMYAVGTPRMKIRSFRKISLSRSTSMEKLCEAMNESFAEPILTYGNCGIYRSGEGLES
jgi:hypothetical protein